MKKFLYQIVQWTWCLPQNIAGAIMWLIFKWRGCETEFFKWRVVTRWKRFDGVSLGQFIFVNENESERTVKHEYGHTRQSLMLGWFYLLAIGLPSLIWAGCFGKYRVKHNVSYYKFYTERWADKLGGVERS